MRWLFLFKVLRVCHVSVVDWWLRLVLWFYFCFILHVTLIKAIKSCAGAYSVWDGKEKAQPRLSFIQELVDYISPYPSRSPEES